MATASAGRSALTAATSHSTPSRRISSTATPTTPQTSSCTTRPPATLRRNRDTNNDTHVFAYDAAASDCAPPQPDLRVDTPVPRPDSRLPRRRPVYGGTLAARTRD